jgi:hypothetical protein
MSDDVKPWDMINGSPRSPEEIVAARLAICKTCEFFKERTQRCGKCGCFMKMKTKLSGSSCPIGKW